MTFDKNIVLCLAPLILGFSGMANADELVAKNSGTSVVMNWKSERVVPDGDYAVNLEGAFTFTHLAPLSMIATPVDIVSVDNRRSLPKGTILAWDAAHTTACEPVRRQGAPVFVCLEDSRATGRFDVISEIPTTGVMQRTGRSPVGGTFEYLIGNYVARSPKPIAPIDTGSFASVTQFDPIDIEIYFEWQYKFKEAAFSICTERNVGKRLLSGKHDVIEHLCAPNLVYVTTNELPKMIAVHGYNLTFSKFDDNDAKITVRKIEN